MYIIIDKRFTNPNTKVIVTNGERIQYDDTVKNVLACNMFFTEEADAERYSNTTWGADYADYVRIIPLVDYKMIKKGANHYSWISDDEMKSIKKILSKGSGFDISEIDETQHIVKDLGMDSLDQIETIMELEKEFSMSIPDDDVESLTTVGQVLNYLNDKFEHIKRRRS